MAFTKSYETDGSYAYHPPNQVVEHWAFKKRRPLQPDEIGTLKVKIVVQDGHLWIKDTARVAIY